MVADKRPAWREWFKARLWIRLAIGLLVLFFAWLHLTDRWAWQLLERIENIVYDVRVQASATNTVDPRVVIVDVDERSLAIEGQWPWSRDRLALLVDRLFDEYQVEVVGFDIAFVEQDDLSARKMLGQLETRLANADQATQEALLEVRNQWRTDDQFAEALSGRKTVLGFIMDDVKSKNLYSSVGMLPPPLRLQPEHEAKQYRVPFIEQGGYLGNLPELQMAAASAGFFDNSRLDRDGVFRRVPLMQALDGELYPSLALATVRMYLDDPPVSLQFISDHPQDWTGFGLEAVQVGELRVPVDEELVALVPFRGPQYSFPYVSATSVLRGEADKKQLQGSIVLVGTSAPGLFDLRSTPVGGSYAGVEVHANLISGMLDGRVNSAPEYADGIAVLVMLLIGVVYAVMSSRLGPLSSLTVALSLAAIYTAMCAWFWGQGLVLPLAVPWIYLLLVVLTETIYGYFVESRNKRQLSRVFGQYIPPELVEELGNDPKEVSLAGQARDMSVLFSDVRGFTTISEGFKDKPEELTQLMNEFLTPITEVIHTHRGTIDKYMGDAVMAFWGAPLTDENHAAHSVEAAMRMIKAMEELAPKFAARGWPTLQVGVGINSGVMNVGNMGSRFRMAYTVMGDAVNLGSRLEGLTKQYGVQIIASETTVRAVPAMTFRELDLVRVKGKDEPVAIYEPVGYRSELTDDQKSELSRYRQVLKRYRKQEWDQAEAELFGLQQSYQDRLIYRIYLQRIHHFRQESPGADWDGVFTHTSK